MNSERIYTLLQAPVISEKAGVVSELANQYVFKVSLDAKKLEIKHAVESLFNVKVINVSTAVVKGKVKQNKYGKVHKSNWKKAYVRVAEGYSIDIANV